MTEVKTSTAENSKKIPREEGIKGLRFKSKKQCNILNKTPIEIERRIIQVRRATGFGSEQLASIVNESLDIEHKNIRHIEQDHSLQHPSQTFTGRCRKKDN